MTPTPEQAKELLSYLPKRPDYYTWIYSISAIGNTFPESIANDIILSHYTEEKNGETLYKLNKKLQGVGFATLVYLAKQYGYKPKTTYSNHYYNPFASNGIMLHTKFNKQLIKFNDDPELIYRFKDYELEERASIMEFDGNMTRLQAEKMILKENPNAEKERIFRVGINKKIINKNINPKTNEVYKNGLALTNGFKNCLYTLNDIVLHIGKGFPIIFCHLKEDKNGVTYRKQENFICSDMFAVDIDDGMKIETAFEKPETRKALLLYTTASHTQKHHRFRIIFPLPRLIKSLELFRKIIEKFIDIYNADKNCKDPVRAFYGNNNATIYIIPKGEILEFKGGVLL